MIMVGNQKMKRSEMVMAIAIELMGRLPEWEKQERLNFASEILQVCEIEGMVPPLNENWMSMDECVDFYGPSWENDVNTYPRKNVHRWGPEDEKI